MTWVFFLGLKVIVAVTYVATYKYESHEQVHFQNVNAKVGFLKSIPLIMLQQTNVHIKHKLNS